MITYDTVKSFLVIVNFLQTYGNRACLSSWIKYAYSLFSIPDDSLPSERFPTDASPMSPSRPRVRYLAICQAGILAAAFCGIDLGEVLNVEAELNLEKKEKKDSVSSRETVSLSNTPIYNRKLHPNGTRSTVDLYGTYRRRRDDDTFNSRQQLDDLMTADIIQDGMTPSHHLSYNDSYSEQDTIHFRDEMYLPNAAGARYQRESSTEKPPIDYQHSKSASPIRRASPSDPFDVKPQRPKTLDVTPEHIVQGVPVNSTPTYRFNVSNVSKNTGSISNHAFANSNTSSSSQSPASTPSPKLINKSQTLIIDPDRVDKVKTMPGRIHQPPNQYTQTTNGGSTRPRVQNNAFSQSGVVKTNNMNSSPNTTAASTTSVAKQTDFIAFI